MLAFSNEEPKPQINHKNARKDDNRITNLEWCTNRENRIHSLKNELKDEINYGIATYDTAGNLLKVYDTCREALKEMNKDYKQSGNIGRVVRGSRKTAYGYVWKQYEGSTTILNGSTFK